ncbi:hypothetical protein M404DRAFT_1006409 [Pisolithus tinctorius Marx 270]|uniref:Uncharacterized protein n=1 Tax=Pisolithus tinctorius Marx 270 TaxID=870435 RepID=A0A0C3NNP4_PISTI|nr:hypothetical protein M404DRAFT_1006409 [Pisolithus tinctorius Marx 270]
MPDNHKSWQPGMNFATNYGTGSASDVRTTGINQDSQYLPRASGTCQYSAFSLISRLAQVVLTTGAQGHRCPNSTRTHHVFRKVSM